jgi:hypothetical protein
MIDFSNDGGSAKPETPSAPAEPSTVPESAAAAFGRSYRSATLASIVAAGATIPFL